MLALAASAEHVAAACASGRVKLFSAATLEEAAVLAAPLRGASAVACVFSGPGGGELTVSYKGGGGAAVASWDLGQAPPALVDVSLRACHRWVCVWRRPGQAGACSDRQQAASALQRPLNPFTSFRSPRCSDAITDAVAFTAAGTGERLVATCGLDSQLCIWSCGSGAAALAPASALDLHALLGTSRPRLLCLAVSSDGQLLSCGAGGGFVHVFSLASPAAPTKLATQRVADADVTSLCFDSGSGSSTLAVGCKRGTVRLVRFQHDGSCATLAAPLEDHKAAVTGLALGAARGQAWLCSAGADGRRLTYSWAPPAGAGTVQPQLTGQAAVPRCSWVGLAPAGGDAVVAASKAGRVVCASPAEAGAETSLWALLSRNQGEGRWLAALLSRCLHAPCA